MAYSKMICLKKPKFDVWFWVLVVSLVMFLMSYASEQKVYSYPLHNYHYLVIGIIILYLIFGKISINHTIRLLPFNIGPMPSLFGVLFLAQMLLSSFINQYGIFSAVHVTIWILMVIFFWRLFFGRFKNVADGIVFGWLGVVLISLIAMLIGFYIKFVGPLAIFGLVFEQGIWDRTGMPWTGVIGWFPSPNYSGSFFLNGFIGSFFCLLFAKRRVLKLFLRLSAALFVLGILFAGSRSAIFGLLLFVVVVCCGHIRNMFMRQRTFFKVLIYVLMVVSIANSAIYPYVLKIGRLNSRIIEFDGSRIIVSTREVVWNKAIDGFKSGTLSEQFLGLGSDGSVLVMDYSTHSGWLTILLNHGFLGLLLSIAFFTTLLLKVTILFRQERGKLIIKKYFLYQMGFLISFGAINMTTAIIPTPRVDMFVFLFALSQFGIVNAYYRKCPNIITSSSRTRKLAGLDRHVPVSITAI